MTVASMQRTHLDEAHATNQANVAGSNYCYIPIRRDMPRQREGP